MACDLKGKLRNIVRKYILNEELGDKTNIFELTDVDSITFVRILVEIENFFSIEIPADFLLENYWNCIDKMEETLKEILRDEGESNGVG